jgi:hypothetical protein
LVIWVVDCVHVVPLPAIQTGFAKMPRSSLVVGTEAMKLL